MEIAGNLGMISTNSNDLYMAEKILTLIESFSYLQYTSIEPLYMICILGIEENGALGVELCKKGQMTP